MANPKKTSPLFKIFKSILRMCYIKMQVAGKENLPEGAVIIVANHCQMHGPLACELYLPGNRYTWCAGQMMNFKEVPSYAFEDFWSQKPKRSQPFYRLMSYLIAPLAVFLFNNANTIAVYKDTRAVTTFKQTVSKLEKSAQIVIFPEHDVKNNNIVYEFQDKFVDVARLYLKRTGKNISFVPMYIAPKLKKMCLGTPIAFCGENPIEEERKRICDYLSKEITEIAVNLPKHTVVPYRNIPKKFYPTNK